MRYLVAVRIVLLLVFFSMLGVTNIWAEDNLDEHLLFYLDFEGSPDAVVSKGEGKATVTGTPVYEESPDGKGVVISKGVSLSYLPEGNINLQKGKIYVHFKPLWHGGDKITHYFLTVAPVPGLIYFGKLDDGRLICNLFDKEQKQHYPWYSIRDMEPGKWHKATVTWNADKGGIMYLYLDGEKVAESGELSPWQMGELNNNNEKCRIIIDGAAEAVIDEIKIWDSP